MYATYGASLQNKIADFPDDLFLSYQIFGENACHLERSEGSGSSDAEILRGVYPERSEWAQDDSQDTAQLRSREAFSPNVKLVASSIDNNSMHQVYFS